MTADNRKFSQDSGQETTDLLPASAVLDLGFLAAQTFGDTSLEREVLDLFVAQTHRLLPRLATLAPPAQADTAHLLKGSARGIGAWAVADAAGRYEVAAPADRAAAGPELERAVAAAEAAIARRLAAIRA